MPKKETNPNRPPKKFQPRGLTILYEDRDILVVDKKSGLLSISTEFDKEKTVYHILTDYVRRGNQKSRNRVFIVHRLDRDTSGLMVFAKTEEAKTTLQDSWETAEKTYFAVVHGFMPEEEDVIETWLTENSIHRMYSVHDPEKGKHAVTRYRVMRESRHYSLLSIDLLTGRKHQIRVHMAEEGCPVVGDDIYGNKARNKGIKRMTLHAGLLTITHPFSGKLMTFESRMPFYFEQLLKEDRLPD